MKKMTFKTKLQFLLVALFALVSGGALAGNVITLSTLEINAGESGEIVVGLQNDEEVSNFQFEFSLPEGLTLVDYTVNTERLKSRKHTVTLVQQTDVEGNELNSYFVLITSPTNTPIAGNEGALLTLKVTASQKIEGSVAVEGVVAANSSTNEETNTNQVVEVQVPDASEPVKPRAKVASMTAEDLLVDLDTNAEGNYSIKVSLESEYDVSAVRFKLTLPEGLTLATNSEGESFEYTDRIPLEFTFSTNEKEDGSIIVLLTGYTTSSIAAGEGELFTIDLKAASQLAETATVTISDIEISSEDDASIPTTYNKEIALGVTNVTRIATLEANAGKGAVEIYSVSGQRLAKPVKGALNILKYADGSVQKVLVK
jgi:hypothetical protein